MAELAQNSISDPTLMNDGQTHRPVTSKARGFCKYYSTTRGCFSGDSCKFLHISESSPEAPPPGQAPLLTPFDKSKKCKFYAKGYCKRGGNCWFLHVKDTSSQRIVDEEDDDHCSICFEKPHTYGLLTGCSHVFCLQCLRQWRDPSGRNRETSELNNTKKCPMCRASSRYIIPSSIFYKEGQEEKKIVTELYKESMNKVPCKHFEASKAKNTSKPLCPFGRDCFYRHTNADGSEYIFKQGVDTSMRAFYHRSRPTLDFYLGGTESDIDSAGLAGNIAMDMFDSIITDVMQGAAPREGISPTSGQDFVNVAIDRVTMGRARDHMMSAALSAIRAELTRLEGSRSDPNLPAAGDSTPNEMEIDIMERLDMLAEQMIGTTSDSNRPRPQTPPGSAGAGVDHMPESNSQSQQPSSTTGLFAEPQYGLQARRRRPVVVSTANDDDDDEIPELEIVSDSSSENMQFSDSSDEELSDSETVERVSSAIWALDFAFTHPAISGNASGTSLAPQLARHVDSSSPRFSTVVERDTPTPASEIVPQSSDTSDETPQLQEAPAMISHVAEPDVVAAHEPSIVHPMEPPFVTDGRGRVVWTNKNSVSEAPLASSTSTVQSSEHSSDAHPTDTNGVSGAAEPRSLLGRMFDALF